MMTFLLFKLKQIVIAGLLLLVAVLSLVVVRPVYADCATNPTEAGCPCALNSSGSVCKDLGNKDGLSNTIKSITNIVLFIAGILAVIMIIYGAIRFITAHGDAKQVATARLIVTYSVVGLIIAILAYAIVNFVLEKL